jgi:phosphoribosyl-AMP cyclohydrolase / phosphoribosyl-ATP pyrophosphohydrolase
MGATMSETPSLHFDANGLVTVVVQDQRDGEVRMVAHATTDAVRATLTTGKATFWSRSRGALWVKGETSGNAIDVEQVLVDCDADCLVYSAEPHGPSCHTGAQTCFFRVLEEDGALTVTPAQPQTTMARLEATLTARKASSAEKSYTKSLYDGGPAKIGAKIREEAGELAEALASESDARVVSEAADVMYHLMVGLRQRGIAWRDVLATLDARTSQSGHAEKASRRA